jgi:hypothetical protein
LPRHREIELALALSREKSLRRIRAAASVKAKQHVIVAIEDRDGRCVRAGASYHLADAPYDNRRTTQGRITMKAVFIERFGGPDVLSYGDLPDPVAGAGEVVIDLVAASVNGLEDAQRPVSASHVSTGPRPGFFRHG